MDIDITENRTATRPSCKYGNFCYRRNPVHRLEEAHPSDNDYILPQFPQAPENAPECPFGDKCYRLNGTHLENYAHPLYANPQENLRKYHEGTLYTDENIATDNEPLSDDSRDSIEIEYITRTFCNL